MKRKLSNYSLPSHIFILLLLAGSVFGGYERISYPVAPGTNKVLTLPEGLKALNAPVILVKSNAERITDGVMTISNAYIDSETGGIINHVLGNITGATNNKYNILAYLGDVTGNDVADLIYLNVIKSEHDSIYFVSGRGLIDSFIPYTSISTDSKSYSFQSEYRSPDSFCLLNLNDNTSQEFVSWYEKNQMIIIDEVGNRTEPEDSITGITPLLSSSPETHKFYHGDFDWDGKEDFVIAGYLFRNLGNFKFKKYPLDVIAGKALRFVGTTDYLFSTQKYKSHLLFAREGVSFEGDEIVIAEFVVGSGIREKDKSKFEGIHGVDKAWLGNYSESTNLSSIAAFSPDQGKLVIHENLAHRLITLFTTDSIPIPPDSVHFVIRVPHSSRDTSQAYIGEVDPDYLSGSNTVVIDNLKGCTSGGPVDLTEDSQTDWVFLDTVNDSLITLQYNEPLYVDKTNDRIHMDATELAGLAVAVGDYNNDGFEDVFIANAGGPDKLLRNLGGSFRDVAAEAGVANNNDGISAAWGDYDSDGNLDLVVTGFSLAIKLYRNRGDGTFEDKSSILPTRDPNQRITSVSWGDINHDGWLDMLLGNYDGPDMIYLNASASLPGTTYTGRKFALTKLYFDNRTYYNTESAALIDINNDMLLDIVSVPVDGPINLLMSYHNQYFADSTSESGFNSADRTGKIGQSMCWGDLDGDSYPDLYLISNQTNDMLYINTSDIAHRNKFSAMKFGSPGGKYGEMSGVIDDLTGDGVQDLLLARSSQFGDLIAKPQDFLLSYSGSALSALSPSSDGARLGLTGNELSCLPVSADFDRDGDLDLLFVNYLPDNSSNLFFGSKAPLRYLENQSQQSSLVSISLFPASGKISTGARAELTYNRKIYSKVVSGGIGRIQSGQKLSFNLGRDVSFADSLIVFWPSGNISRVNGPIYPGEMKVYEKRYKYTIDPVNLPGIYPDQEELYVGPDSFEVVVDIEDSFNLSASDSVNLTIKENLYTSSKTVKQMQQIDSTMNRFRAYIKNPGQDQTRYYFISIRQNGTLAGNYPENTTIYKKLTISEQIRLGDVNFNGMLDFLDAMFIAKILAYPDVQYTDEERFRADFNQDGKINMQDADLIFNYRAN